MREKLYFEDECYYLSQNERKDRIPVYRGSMNIYIEKWTDGNGKYLDVAYTELDLQAAGGAYYFRKACFERHGFRGCFIVSLTYPPKEFDNITPIPTSDGMDVSQVIVDEWIGEKESDGK